MKFKKGDLVKIMRIYSYDNENSMEKRRLSEIYVNRAGEIDVVDKYSEVRYYCYYVKFNDNKISHFYAREMRLLTEREQFLYHILGSDALKEKI